MEKELSCSNYDLLMDISTSNNNNNNCYWENLNDQNTPFQSALSSMVSSPTLPSSSSSNGYAENKFMIKELIGRLGSICDSSDEILHTNSSYNTPINSPSKFNHLMIMSNNNHNHNHNNYPNNLDPGFIDRAAKFSSFGNSINNNNNNNFNGKINSNNGDSREGSSLSEQNPGVELPIYPQNNNNNNAISRKRKSISKAKIKEFTPSPSLTKIDKAEVNNNEESDAKRSKVEKEIVNEKENSRGINSSNKDKKKNNNNNEDDNKGIEKAEPPKDYIHVRARRGQATDSHSLAERVRREKISERMKFLQDLVPGCNKVTGKATVLDEIINYVQSLQHQVEFLSMKLSTMNPRVEFDMEALLSKEMFQSRGSSFPQAMYSLDQNSGQEFPFAYQSALQMSLPYPNVVPNGIENPFSVSPLSVPGIQRNPNIQLPSIDGFADSLTQSQLPTLWEDDLQSIVQMGIVPNQTQSVPGTLPTNAHMKVEL